MIRFCLLPVVILTLGPGGGLFCPAPAVAQEPSAPAVAQEPIPPLLPDSLLAVTVEGIPGTPLTLVRTLELGQVNATSIGEARAALHAAQGAVRREKGIFDPELFAELDRRGEDSPTASFFAGADVLETEETAVRGGARMKLRLGTELEASVNTTRLATNSAFATLNPEYDTFGLLSLRQPLLSGFGPAARRDLSAAERELSAARARYDDALLELGARAEEGYWDVYAAERDYAVRVLIRDRARAFLSDAEVRARAGLVGPNQVANARVFLAEQELALLDAEERLDRTSDRLASIIGTRPNPDSPRYRPIDDPGRDYPVGEVNVWVVEAVRANHQLRAERAIVEQFKALAGGARWDALPDLDLLASIGGNGLSGRGREVVFGNDTIPAPDVDGGFGQTWAQVRDREFPTWSVGLRLSVPIGLREGRGERDRLKAEVARAQARLEGDERVLEEEVRQAHREVVHGAARLTAARAGAEAAEEQVRIGLIEFRSGRNTAFELVRLGADFAAAQQRYSQALVATAKAAARLRYLTSGAYPALTPEGSSR